MTSFADSRTKRSTAFMALPGWLYALAVASGQSINQQVSRSAGQQAAQEFHMKLVRPLSLALAGLAVAAPGWAAQRDQHKPRRGSMTVPMRPPADANRRQSMMGQRMAMVQAIMADRLPQTPAKP